MLEILIIIRLGASKLDDSGPTISHYIVICSRSEMTSSLRSKLIFQRRMCASVTKRVFCRGKNHISASSFDKAGTTNLLAIS